jgi:trehalose 6-phosphate phosphatase
MNTVAGSEAPAFVSPPVPDLAATALFLDVDGTLLDIALTPEAVVIPADLPGLLGRLSSACGGAFALVTGREIAVVDRFFAPHRYAVGGIHGSELRLADGSRADTPPHPDLPRITGALESLADGRAGLLVEKKGRAVAIHYRLAPELGPEVESFVRSVAGGSDGLEIQPGKMVVEIRPARADKGVAIDRFMEDAPFAGRLPLFIGDDWTDESAFAAVNRAGGRSIRVGEDERPTQARERLKNPSAVLDWLRQVAGSAIPA